MALAPGVSPAILIRDADARICRDGIISVSQALPDPVRKPRERLIRIIHARRQTISNELNEPRLARQLDELFALRNVYAIDLDAVAPISDPHLEGRRADRSSQLNPLDLGTDEKMGTASRDIGELPVETAEAISDEGAVDGMLAESDGDSLSCESEPNSGGTRKTKKCEK